MKTKTKTIIQNILFLMLNIVILGLIVNFWVNLSSKMLISIVAIAFVILEIFITHKKNNVFCERCSIIFGIILYLMFVIVNNIALIEWFLALLLLLSLVAFRNKIKFLNKKVVLVILYVAIFLELLFLIYATETIFSNTFSTMISFLVKENNLSKWLSHSWTFVVSYTLMFLAYSYIAFYSFKRKDNIFYVCYISMVLIFFMFIGINGITFLFIPLGILSTILVLLLLFLYAYKNNKKLLCIFIVLLLVLRCFVEYNFSM